jgi:diketogulonate reductase-like aldo/keto reductase
MQTRLIPATKESLPVIGCGTYRTFDVGAAPEERAPLLAVLKALFTAGGSVIDSSPMYGEAEGVVGELLERAQIRSHAFLATKVWTSGQRAGLDQINRSSGRLDVGYSDVLESNRVLARRKSESAPGGYLDTAAGRHAWKRIWGKQRHAGGAGIERQG